MSTIRFGHFGGYTITINELDPVLNESGQPASAKSISTHCYLDYNDWRADRRIVKLPNVFSVTVEVAATTPEEAQKLAEEAVAKIKPKKTRVTK